MTAPKEIRVPYLFIPNLAKLLINHVSAKAERILNYSRPKRAEMAAREPETSPRADYDLTATTDSMARHNKRLLESLETNAPYSTHELHFDYAAAHPSNLMAPTTNRVTPSAKDNIQKILTRTVPVKAEGEHGKILAQTLTYNDDSLPESYLAVARTRLYSTPPRQNTCSLAPERMFLGKNGSCSAI